MERNFHAALSRVLEHEGGFVNHPKDPGGATNKGVTLKTFRSLVKRSATVSDLKNITDAQLASVYRHFWDGVRASEMPSGVDYSLFDFSVNSGRARAVKALQKVLRVSQDGKIGPVTLAAVENSDRTSVIEALNSDRLAYLKRLKTWKHFGRGWGRRVNDVLKASLDMAGRGGDEGGGHRDAKPDNISYANQNAIRNRPVTDNLEEKIGRAVKDVFGPDYRAEIYSGGQARKGSGGRRTGSVRHDDSGKGGRAADIYVYDSHNNKVQGAELAKLGQYWLAAGFGAVGHEMAGGGIHLDEWTDPPKGGGMLWSYSYSRAQPWGEEAFAMLEAGKKGKYPPLYVSPEPVPVPAPRPQPGKSRAPTPANIGLLTVIAILVLASLTGVSTDDLTAFILEATQ